MALSAGALLPFSNAIRKKSHVAPGRDIVIRMIADRDIEKARKIAGDEVIVTGDANEVVTNPDIDIVVELIGGYTIAKELILKAIENGKHVITANKALLASHGTEIFAAAQKKGVMVAFEAAVAGGIPDYQGVARRIDRQPYRMDCRHHQWHQ